MLLFLLGLFLHWHRGFPPVNYFPLLLYRGLDRNCSSQSSTTAVILRSNELAVNRNSDSGVRARFLFRRSFSVNFCSHEARRSSRARSLQEYFSLDCGGDGRGAAPYGFLPKYQRAARLLLRSIRS